MQDDELGNLLLQLEHQLFAGALSLDESHLDARLDHEFQEVGRSGREYDREDVLRSLAEKSSHSRLIIDNMRCRRLSPTVALLTYRSAEQIHDKTLINHARRVSIWIYQQGCWQLGYHQGTPTAPPSESTAAARIVRVDDRPS